MLKNSSIVDNNFKFFDLEHEEIADLFAVLDENRKGHVQVQELMNAISSIGFEARQTIIYRLLHNIKANGKKTISFNEFKDLMTKKLNETKRKQDIEKIFQIYNKNSTFIDFKMLREMAKELGESIDDSDIQRMIKLADSDKDGKVSFDDFFDVMIEPYEYNAELNKSKDDD